MTFTYRPSLDGIRALAVYVVVLYHSGLVAASGGFIGVDLFFVLSGFLVTSVVIDELDNGTFRPIRFWARRFRRLLPAAAVVVVVTSVVFAAITMPAERELALSDARSVGLYFANWHFLSLGNDYFAADDLARPFTHFWSLAVEEQFYFAFPLIVMASGWIAKQFRRRFRSVFGVVIASLGAASLLVQFVSANQPGMRAYYATDARAYQILLGSLFALLIQSPNFRKRIADIPSVVFSASGVVSLFVFLTLASNAVELSVSVRGVLAAVTSILLICSLELSRNSLVVHLFAIEPLVHLGRLSYGTYLWHWPVIVILDRLMEVGPVARSVTAVVISTALAELSLRFLENPIRRSRQLDPRPRLTVALGLVVSLVITFAVAPQILNSQAPSRLVTSGEPSVVEPPVGSIDFSLPANLDWRAARGDIPVLPDCINTKPEDCIVVVGPPGGLHIHLVGDSHARTLIPAFSSLAKAEGWTFSVTAVGGCPWQQRLRYSDELERTERCDEHQLSWYQKIIPALDPDVVVLFNRAFDDPKFRRRMLIEGEPVGAKNQYEVVQETSEATVAALVQEGRLVVALEQLPLTGRDVTTCLSGAVSQKECTFTASGGPLPTEIVLRYLDLKYKKMVSLDIDALSCPQLPLCLPVVDGLIVRRDAHHLTAKFSDYISTKLGEAIKASGVLKEVNS